MGKVSVCHQKREINAPTLGLLQALQRQGIEFEVRSLHKAAWWSQGTSWPQQPFK